MLVPDGTTSMANHTVKNDTGHKHTFDQTHRKGEKNCCTDSHTEHTTPCLYSYIGENFQFDPFWIRETILLTVKLQITLVSYNIIKHVLNFFFKFGSISLN